MKNTSKIISIILAIMMLVCVGTVASYANDNAHTITIKNETAGHNYDAYQVFSGDITGGKLTNIVWGSGVDGAALLTELKTIAAYADCETAEDVAAILEGFASDSAQIDSFATVASKHLASVAGSSNAPESIGDKYAYDINVNGDGYYFVKDRDGSDLSNDAFTKYILKVVEDVEVDAKDDVPELDKNIVEGEDLVKINNGSIGDVVDFQITSKVPAMDGYETYLFRVSDTLSEGLTFNDDVVVYINGNALDSSAYVVDNAADNATFTVYLNNFIQYKALAGKEVKITYSATINQAAAIGVAGNVNEAYLEYSNNPSQSGAGEGGEPNPNNPTGETPKSLTKTYVTGIELLKVDGSDETPLTGAKFSISGTSQKVVVINSEIYKESNDGTYYRLKDGTYTTTSPETPDIDVTKYEDTTVKYEKVTVIDKTNKDEQFEAEGWVDENGILRFEGLGEGTYTLNELVAPDGYNLITSDITVTITFNNGEWLVSGSGADVDSNGIVKLTVVNNSGAELPSTGGIGTTIFYIIGGLLVISAAVLLVSKKRMAANK